MDIPILKIFFNKEKETVFSPENYTTAYIYVALLHHVIL